MVDNFGVGGGREGSVGEGRGTRIFFSKREGSSFDH